MEDNYYVFVAKQERFQKLPEILAVVLMAGEQELRVILRLCCFYIQLWYCYKSSVASWRDSYTFYC
jgi:hypothetical protein